MMNLDELGKNWEGFGKEDPYWAVLTHKSKKNNKWDQKEFFDSGEKKFKGILKKMGLNNEIGKGRALDFGCGLGRVSQAMCRYYKQVVRVDIAPSMIYKASQLNSFPDQCSYPVNNDNSLKQFESNSFDLIFSYIVLQHISPKYIKQYIIEFLRITKVGGHIVFNLPSHPPFYYRWITSILGHNGLNILRKIYFKKKYVMKMHWINKNEVIELIQTQGSIVELISPNTMGKYWESNFYLIKKVN